MGLTEARLTWTEAETLAGHQAAVNWSFDTMWMAVGWQTVRPMNIIGIFII